MMKINKKNKHFDALQNSNITSSIFTPKLEIHGHLQCDQMVSTLVQRFSIKTTDESVWRSLISSFQISDYK